MILQLLPLPADNCPQQNNRAISIYPCMCILSLGPTRADMTDTITESLSERMIGLCGRIQSSCKA